MKRRGVFRYRVKIPEVHRSHRIVEARNEEEARQLALQAPEVELTFDRTLEDDADWEVTREDEA